MMINKLLKISVRQHAIYIPTSQIKGTSSTLNESTLGLVVNAKKLGFAFSEPLLMALNKAYPPYKLEVLEALKKISGVGKNWTPLVKGWAVPTGESIIDHWMTLVANVLGTKKGTRLPCGHFIPKNTFPLERYNGCPFCGTPFEFGAIENYGQGSKLKMLTLWTEEDVNQYFMDLLSSKTALDATQVDSLKHLLTYYTLPEKVAVGMKETLMLLIDILIETEREEEAGKLFKSPADILRYLWYKHTGFLQIIAPKTIVKKKSINQRHFFNLLDRSGAAKVAARNALKLKYSRKECKRVAQWLNQLNMNVEKSCELMHPKRDIWVRFIRALRLAEYSKRKGFEKLARLLDTFYNETYVVWQGRINHFRLKYDAEQTFALLKKHPGLFSRSLFSNMLWFGADQTLEHFREITNEVPARLLLTLNMYAKNYFNKDQDRLIRPLGGNNKRIPANQLLGIYDDQLLKEMPTKIEDLCIEVMCKRFAKEANEHATIFIAESLYRMPLSIGDRSEMIQDMPSALMGTKYPMLGSNIRLFMQWGEGLPAQPLDMDLSCMVAYEDRSEACAYYRLRIDGCKHSGDIRSIPNKIGTAEYIDIDIDELTKKGARYVSFSCNAYSNGSLQPNMVVGWMDSKHPMKISAKSGVAYDPSCVQHQVRITCGLTKGLVFGVLDVRKREVVWLEMSFGGQTVQNMDVKGVEALLNKLDSKMNIGNLLELKATAQNLQIVDQPSAADEVYDLEWAVNTAAVTQLLVG